MLEYTRKYSVVFGSIPTEILGCVCVLTLTCAGADLTPTSSLFPGELSGAVRCGAARAEGGGRLSKLCLVTTSSASAACSEVKAS